MLALLVETDRLAWRALRTSPADLGKSLQRYILMTLKAYQAYKTLNLTFASGAKLRALRWISSRATTSKVRLQPPGKKCETTLSEAIRFGLQGINVSRGSGAIPSFSLGFSQTSLDLFSLQGRLQPIGFPSFFHAYLRRDRLPCFRAFMIDGLVKGLLRTTLSILGEKHLRCSALRNANCLRALARVLAF
jgi:hypothetical protein